MRLCEDNEELSLVGMIGHEMGNAMTIIKCSLNVLKIRNPQLENTECLKRVFDEVEYIEALVRDISSYNKSGSMEMELENILLYDYISKCVESLKKSGMLQDIKVSVKSTNKELKMRADKVKLAQMIINLVKNSAEAIDGMDGRININISETKRWISIAVKDTGCGISPENIDVIFKPMVTFKKDGTGLGLAIVKEIVDRHNGKIKVASTVNGGTTFKTYFPKILPD